VDRFVNRENIKRYRKLASESTNATERLRIMTLLAEEEAKFKLELSRRGHAPGGGRSPLNATTENPFEYDREEQRGGG
jgi:RNA 3'-terminal phosphate cyclase